jgi:hypothetical protein
MPMCGDVMASDGLVGLRQRHGGGGRMASVWTLEPSPERAPPRACVLPSATELGLPASAGAGQRWALPSSESPTSSRALPAAGRYPSPHPGRRPPSQLRLQSVWGSPLSSLQIATPQSFEECACNPASRRLGAHDFSCFAIDRFTVLSLLLLV